MDQYTVAEFNPVGVTGSGDVNDMFYRMELSGPQGAHFYLLLEDHHTPEDRRKAKAYLRANFDVTGITFLQNNEYKNLKRFEGIDAITEDFAELGEVENIGVIDITGEEIFAVKIRRKSELSDYEVMKILGHIYSTSLREYPFVKSMNMDKNLIEIKLYK